MSTAKKANPATTGALATPRPRRWLELGLIAFALLVFIVGYLSVEISAGHSVSGATGTTIGIFAAALLLAHAMLWWKAPGADQYLLPIAGVLNAIGLVMIHRLDLATGHNLFRSQLMWTAIGLVVFCALIIGLKTHTSLQNYSYVLGAIGLIFAALPIVWPRDNIADASVWIYIGPFSLQPGEFAKILLLVFFSSLLVAKRELFTVAGKRFLGMQFPRLRDLGPVIAVWAIALAIMAVENDFGPALLLFGTVLGMFYIATHRPSWLVIGFALAAVGAVAVYQVSAKIQTRVANSLDPIAHYDNGGLQPSQALFGLSWGGLTGTGLGKGYPSLVPVAHSDYIVAALGEELGFVGLAAIILLYMLFVARGMTTALTCKDTFGKLLASGLALTIAIQVFVVVGGVTTLLPMTGLTTPFVAHGGSSLVANYVLLALLLVISHHSRPSTARVVAS